MTASDTEDWAPLIARHPMFEAMSGEDIAYLLSDEVSQKHVVGKGETILKQDSIGNSLYVVCEGSVSVMLGSNGESFELHRAGEGEVLGEMAIFGHRLRAATLVTAEPCKLLEICGEEFRTLMRKHSDIALYLLAKLSQRLRHTDDLILSRRITGLDGSLGELGTRLDVITQTTDAKLTAAQGLFDQTNARTTELVHSAENRHSLMKWASGAIGAVVMVGGLFGISSFDKLYESTTKELDEIRSEARDTKHVIEGQAVRIKAYASSINASAAGVSKKATEASIAAGRAKSQAKISRTSAENAGAALASALESATEIEQIKSRAQLNMFELMIRDEGAGDDGERFVEIFENVGIEDRARLISTLHVEILEEGRADRVAALLALAASDLDDRDASDDDTRLVEVTINYFLALIRALENDPSSKKFRRAVAKIVDETGYDAYIETIFGVELGDISKDDFLEFATIADGFPDIDNDGLEKLYAALQP